jgi:hypothetical protein
MYEALRYDGLTPAAATAAMLTLLATPLMASTTAATAAAGILSRSLSLVCGRHDGRVLGAAALQLLLLLLTAATIGRVVVVQAALLGGLGSLVPAQVQHGAIQNG